MIVFVQPMYSRAELAADSNYILLANMFRATAKSRPDIQWVVIFPDAKSGYKYVDDGLFNLPNVLRVPQRISTRKRANAISFDASWYDTLFRSYGFDVIWANLVEVAAHLKYAGQGGFEPIAAPAVVNQHLYVIHRSLPYPWAQMEHIALAQLMGSVAADVNVFNSDHCRDMLLDNAEKCLSPDLVDRIRGTVEHIPLGTLELENFPDEPVDQNVDVPIVIYNHRLQGYKRWFDTFDLLAELHAEGVPFKVRYTSSTAESTSKIAKYPFVEFRLNETHNEYLDLLRECHLNVINSQHETFCISAVESMACGQPLLAPDKITFPEITGSASNGYPYLFHNRDEQKEMLRKLLTDAGERAKWGRVAFDHVRSEYTSELWAERYTKLFDRITQYEPGTPQDALDMVAGKLDHNSGKNLYELYRDIHGTKVNGRIPFSSQSLTLTKLMRLVRHVGGRVRMVGNSERVYAPASFDDAG